MAVTGYTAQVIDGGITTLQGYAERCAAAFLFCMRDSNSDKLPDEVPYSKYYQCRLAQAEASHAQLVSMTTDQKDAAWRTAKSEQAKYLDDRLADSAAETERYNRMCEMVEKWDAPTEFSELKKFMMQQLSITRPMSADDIRRYNQPITMTRDEWHSKALDDAAANVTRYRDEHAKEVAKAKRETLFIRGLRDCFKA